MKETITIVPAPRRLLKGASVEQDYEFLLQYIMRETKVTLEERKGGA